jgi:pimeloyl-ACP methyl ester carboxylesterase
LAAPEIPQLLLPGHERRFLQDHVLVPQMQRVDRLAEDLDDFVAAYSRDQGFRGAAALYRSLIAEGDQIRSLAATPLAMPVLAVSGSAGEFVPMSLRNVAPQLEAVTLDGVGHYVALEAPDRLAEVLLPFFAAADRRMAGLA